MKIGFVKLLKSFGINAVAGLAGWQAWLVDVILNKIWKALNKAWKDTLDKISDNKSLKKYADELAKGKDSDEAKKVQDQLELLNPKP